MGNDEARLKGLHELGQSPWLDQISRELIASGALAGLVDDGVGGVTTNPSIFEKAVKSGTSYDDEIAALTASGLSAAEILDRLMIADVQAACDVLRVVYDRTDGRDGFVSIEVTPALADDTEATVAEAARLWALVARPNVMIKIPGTRDGLPAIRRTIAAGINVNITLMFSMAHYEAVVDAYLTGLEDRLESGAGLHGIASVASFFVSRVDTIADPALGVLLEREASEARRERLAALKGRLAVANCKLVYQRFLEILATPRWRGLADAGAGVQRVLWASTSTKNPAYPDLLYVDTLIGPMTVNTLPADTLEAFRDHGTLRQTVSEELDAAAKAFADAAELGLDLPALTEQLQVEGVAAFIKSQDGLLAVVQSKRDEFARR
jgi:transaldolase